MSAKEHDIYAIDRVRRSEASLAAAGVVAGRHRRRDRVASAFRSRRRASRRRTSRRPACVPRRFPRARHYIRRAEWEDATHPHERNRASYLPENFVPLDEAGSVDFHRRRRRVVPGISVRRTGGHTMHHQFVRIESGGRTRGVRRRSDADDRARRRAVDHGLRPLSDGHAGVQEALRARGDRRRVRYLLRARSGDRGRHHPRAPAGASRGARRTDRVLYPCPIHASASSAAPVCTTWPS